MMKKAMITLLLLLTVPLLYAQEVMLINNIADIQTHSGRKSPRSSSPPGIKRISITVRDGNTDAYSLAYPNNRLETTTITLNKGARYQVNVEDTNGRWYYTKELTFQPGNTRDKTESITINGQGLPYEIEHHGKVISSFYNEQNWPAYRINCTHHSGDGLDGVQCLLNNPVGKSPLLVTALQISRQITPYKSSGVIFINSTYVKKGLSKRDYNINLTSFYGHEQLKITDSQGHTIGRGILILSENNPPPQDNALFKGTFTHAP